MEPSVRALFTVCEIDGKIIVSAEIPGVDKIDAFLWLHKSSSILLVNYEYYSIIL